jgi:peptide/nickel transport system substrate-binding protein
VRLDRRSVLGGAASVPFLALHAAAARGNVLNAMMPAEPGTLCYPLLNTRTVQQICGNIQESLLLLDWNFKPQPNLARSFTVTPDGLVYVFHLEPDVRWHDGAPFTARDVVFSCDKMLRQLNPRSRNAFNNCESIRALDGLTVEFRLKQPFNAFLLSLMASNAPIMPAHIYEGSDFRTNPHNFRPIGTGPFKFARWERGQYIRLTRNPDYWRKGYPRIDDIYFRVCPTPEQRMVALETGAVDIALADDIDTVVSKRLRANPNIVASTHGYEGVGEIQVFEMNQRRWPFSDRRFRQAFMHALDRDFIVNAINFGQGKVATSPIPSSAPYYDPRVLTRYDYNPATARAMLDEMGLKKKLGGVRHRFGFLMIPDGGGVQTRGAQYVRQAASEVGLDIELQSSDWATFAHRTGNWDFDMDNNSYGEYGDPAIGTSRFFVSANIRKGVPQSNIQGYRNAEVDDLFAKASTAIDPKEAQAHYSRLQQILTRDVAMLWVFERDPMLYYNKRVHDLVSGPNGPTDGFGRTWLSREA